MNGCFVDTGGQFFDTGELDGLDIRVQSILDQAWRVVC